MYSNQLRILSLAVLAFYSLERTFGFDYRRNELLPHYSGSRVEKRSATTIKLNCNENMFVQDLRCVSDCGPGQFADKSSGACEKCSSNCKTCSLLPNNCTSCSSPNYLLDNSCVENCGSSKLQRGPPRNLIRLQGGKNEFEGRVEILHEGEWGTVCDDGWDMSDAQVVCKELQLGNAVEALTGELSGEHFGEGSHRMPILLDNVECKGDESELKFCGHNQWGQHNCGHFEDAGVRCSGPDLSRLCVSECGDGFFHSFEQNVCEICQPECLTCFQRADHCLTCDYPRFLKDSRCVEECGIGYYGHTPSRTCRPCHDNCRNCLDGAIDHVCTSCHDQQFLRDSQCVDSCLPQFSKNKAVRLVGGVTSFEGRVEVYYDGQWGTVCDDSWDISDADVICRELGYGRALAAVRSPAFGPGKGSILMDNVDCSGDEAELFHCPQMAWGENDCSHHEDAGVRCAGTDSTDPYRLIFSLDISQSKDGATGKCLDDCGIGYWNKEGNICVPCSSECLDCTEPSQCTKCKPPQFLKNHECVSECGPNEYGNTRDNVCKYCDRTQCAKCLNGETNNNCTECSYGKVLKGSSCELGCGPDMFQMNSSCLAECPHGWYGNPSTFKCEACPANCLTCSYDSTNTLVCKSCRTPLVFDQGRCLENCPYGLYASMVDPSSLHTTSQIRLVGGYTQLEGRLEVLHDGNWGTVCNDFWDMEAADVACRDLNLGAAEGIFNIMESYIEPGTGTILLDNVMCQGTEEHLIECYHLTWGDNNCNHQKDVAIRCSGPGIRQCLSQCPAGTYSSGQDQTCRPCQENCLDCGISPSGHYFCHGCRAGTFNNGTACVDHCEPGHYQDDSTTSCRPCSPQCATCSMRSDECTSCSPPNYLLGQHCVSQCREYRLATYDKVRLVGGRSSLEGRVEVKLTPDSEFGTICDDKWDLNDAEVICRELNLGHALEAVGEGGFGHGNGQIVLDEVKCAGNESSIFACQHAGLGMSDCRHSEDAGVRCSGPDMSRICLSECDTLAGHYVADNGLSCGKCSHNCLTCEDTPEKCTKCPKGLYINTNHRCVEKCEEGFYGDTGGLCKPCNDDCKDCSGSNSTCIKCHSDKFLSMINTCVGSCGSGYIMRGSSEIRLVGTGDYQGRVEVFHNGIWGTICDDGFNIEDAAVVCRQLGFGKALFVQPKAHYGEGNGPILMDDVECLGTERTLGECPFHRLGFGFSDCQHSEDVGVQCEGPDSSQQCVQHCGDGYYPGDNQECQHCSASCKTCTGPDHCTSCSAPYFLRGNQCNTTCEQGQYGNTGDRLCKPCHPNCASCYSAEHNSICKTCKPGFVLEGSACVSQCGAHLQVLQSLLPVSPSNIAVRLVNEGDPTSSTQGRVEVLHNHQWGTVCDRDWNLDAAQIVCTELGLGKAVSAPLHSRFGTLSRSTPIWMDGIRCLGYESSLTQCEHDPWGQHTCDLSHSEDAGVICDGSDYRPPTMDVCHMVMGQACTASTCYQNVNCVDLDHGQSVCLPCPDNHVGDGINCIVVATELPEFKLKPENRTARLGFPATISCQADGTPAPSITTTNWLRDGRPLREEDVNNGRVSVLLAGHLHFSRTHREDTAEYTCIIRNTRGQKATSAHLHVEEKPEVIGIVPGKAVINETAELRCIIAGIPEANVTWQLNGQPLTSERYESYDENGTLYIDQVNAADSGDYRCIAENSLGIDFASLPLNVQEPPVFRQPPQDIYVEKDVDVELPCWVTGIPVPYIIWKKDGNDVDYSKDSMKYKLLSTGTLQIKSVEREDMGVYTCIAINSVEISTRQAKLLVLGPPVIVSPPKNESLVAGETVTIPCQIIGALEPTITWQLDGQWLNTNSAHYQTSQEGLTIISADAADSGQYTCVATNSEGSVSSSAYVSVTGVQQVSKPPISGMAVGLAVGLIVLMVAVILLVVILCRRAANKGKQYNNFNGGSKAKQLFYKGGSSNGQQKTMLHTVEYTSGNDIKINRPIQADTQRLVDDEEDNEIL